MSWLMQALWSRCNSTRSSNRYLSTAHECQHRHLMQAEADSKNPVTLTRKAIAVCYYPNLVHKSSKEHSYRVGAATGCCRIAYLSLLRLPVVQGRADAEAGQSAVPLHSSVVGAARSFATMGGVCPPFAFTVC